MDTASYSFDIGSMSVSKRRSNDKVSSTADANSSHYDFALSVNDCHVSVCINMNNLELV